PLKNHWGPHYPDGCGISDVVEMIAPTITNIFIDIIILVLPIPTLIRVQLPVRERIVLVILMSIGLVACVASIVRTYYMWVTVVQSYDISWWAYDAWLWNIIELNLSATCASVPTLRPLYHRIVVEGMRSITSGRDNAKYEMSSSDGFAMSKRDFEASQIRQMTTIEIEEEYDHDRSLITSRLEAGTLDGHRPFRQPG
ncbi:hypothetical protein KEM56_006003, partial [Ascosphaera pollenicola]